MRSTPLRAAALAGATALTVAFATSAAAGPAAGDPEPERVEGAYNYTGFTPAVASADRRVKAILKLAGKPVAVRAAEARARGTSLSTEEKAAIRRELRAAQAAVAGRVRGLGGEVLADYADAYNGLAVRVSAGELTSLASLPGVVAVHAARIFERTNTAGVQYIEANDAWQDTGYTGEGVKIAVLDTGVDYYHANLGGSGDPADFAADDSTVVEPGSFPTAKVVAGTDLVGDDYNANSSDPAINTPNPDPDPLDCNGHGTHVAGTAAGIGILDDGSVYGGPYNGSTHSSNSFRIGPGAAPEAEIIAIRVFGCAGSSSEEVIVEALDTAVGLGADVINMSLGSPFGRTDEPSVEASNNAADAGAVVVASAGNSGPGAYITGAPAIADKALSVAALDASSPTIPGATVTLSTGETIVAQNSNDAALPSGPLPVAVLRTSYPDGPIALGCDPAEYDAFPGGVAGKLVVTLRGVCARVARAVHGQKAGAAAVAMINTSSSYPPFEGPITSNPDTGEEFEVTIPFLGVRGELGTNPTDDGDKLVAADGGSATLAPTDVPNPGYARFAGFTSNGPRNVDSAPKPEVTAPGVAVQSSLVGTGNKGARFSGTSMAAPHTAGVAALVTQARPEWSTEAIKAAIMNTADATSAKILGYDPRRGGTGVVDARKAVDTVAYATTPDGRGTLGFGYEPLAGAYSETLSLTLQNTSGSDLTYALAASFVGSARGTDAAVSPSSVTVPAGGSASVEVTLTLEAAEVAALPGASASNFGTLVSVQGAVTATPTAFGSGVYGLRVPFVLVPRGLSDVTAAGTTGASPTRGGPAFTSELQLRNAGTHGATALVYQWGLADANDVPDALTEDGLDLRAVGVRTTATSDPANPFVRFAINVHGKWSNASVNEFDVVIDTDGDGSADRFVVGFDLAILTGSFSGQYVSYVFGPAPGFPLLGAWVATAPMNGSVIELPALASQLGLSADGDTDFTYSVAGFSVIPSGLVDTTGTAAYDAFAPSLSNGQAVPLAPGASELLTVGSDRVKAAREKALGWLVVAMDDANGGSQADTVALVPPKK